MNLPKITLPELKFSTKKGFTLVELMIVVAIIAVLSVIGVTVFSGIQKDSRDARRRADIDAIASAMEANYGKTTAGQYNAMAATFFASNAIPSDPTSTSVAPDSACPGVCKYCVLQGLAQQTAAACSIASTAVAVGAPAGGSANPYWMVCSNLEKTAGTFYCRGNQQ
jgi:prepilin-type N-terminal cleavage/methylation domain-containing protein